MPRRVFALFFVLFFCRGPGGNTSTHAPNAKGLVFRWLGKISSDLTSAILVGSEQAVKRIFAQTKAQTIAAAVNLLPGRHAYTRVPTRSRVYRHHP